jgi:hypothetical protein
LLLHVLLSDLLRPGRADAVRRKVAGASSGQRQIDAK